MMPLLGAFLAHFLADFPGQAFFQKWMGRKHESLVHLTTHAMAYTAIFAIVLAPFLGPLAVQIAFINGLAHWVIDYWTSRASHYCHERAKLLEDNLAVWPNAAGAAMGWRGSFWCVIGFDQFLHMALIGVTLASAGLL